MLKTMKAELRKWRVNPKTLPITPPIIRRNYTKKSLTDGAFQFKIPISGVKLLKTKKPEAAKKKKRRPSKKTGPVIQSLSGPACQNRGFFCSEKNAKKKKRRPSKKTKAPSSSPSLAQPARTEVRYMSSYTPTSSCKSPLFWKAGVFCSEKIANYTK